MKLAQCNHKFIQNGLEASFFPTVGKWDLMKWQILSISAFFISNSLVFPPVKL